MTLAELSSIGNLVSSVAVLVSLAYLSLQMRQTERNQRAMLNQGAIDRAAETVRWHAQADTSGLIVRVNQGDRTFSAQELYQLSMILRRMLLALQDVYVQRKVALVDHITVEHSVNAAKSLMVQPVFKALWMSGRNSYAQEFAAYVDQLIEGTPLVAPVDTVARFNATLAQLAGAEPS